MSFVSRWSFGEGRATAYIFKFITRVHNSMYYRPPSQGGPPAATHQSREAKLASVLERPNASVVFGVALTARVQARENGKVFSESKAEPMNGGFDDKEVMLVNKARDLDLAELVYGLLGVVSVLSLRRWRTFEGKERTERSLMSLIWVLANG